MTDDQESEVKPVSLDCAFAVISCAAFLYAISWISGCSASPAAKPGGGKKISSPRQATGVTEEGKTSSPVSGRKLTIERMTQRAATSLQYSNEEFGVAFDAPKGYVLKEGELTSMDRGLGYLGPIPMHFAEAGGVRLATVEAPQGLHLGTNFVNEFFTVSANYGSTEAGCADFNIPAEVRGAAVTRSVDGIDFHGFAEHSATSMHEYKGIYLHAYSNNTCYELGYGVATAGFGGTTNASGSLKNINQEKLLNSLDRILDNVRINPPEFERNSVTD
jgi:hypothetical protein